MNELYAQDPTLDPIFIEPYDVVPTLTKIGSEDYQNLLQNPVVQNDIETANPEEFASIIFGSVQINYADFCISQSDPTIDSEPTMISESQTSLDFDDQTLDPGPGMEHYAYEQVPFSPAPFMHHHPVFVVSPGKGFMFPNNPANENSDGNKKSLGKSRDDPLLRRLGIPRTVDEITTMTIEDFQRYIRPFTNEMQSYLKKIRRRGKNKIAARNSRARRESKGFTMEDQFETLQYEHESLLNAQNQVQNRIEEEKRISCDLLPETFDEITPIMDDGFEIFGTENNQNFNFYIGY